MKVTTYRFRRIDVVGHAGEFVIHVACEELGNPDPMVAWLLAAEQANRHGPWCDTKSLEMVERIIPAGA